MRSGRDLEDRLKRERPAAAQKTNETSVPAPAQHRERVQDRRVAYNIQDRVDPFGIAFADPLAEIRGFQQNVARAEPLQHRGARHIAGWTLAWPIVRHEIAGRLPDTNESERKGERTCAKFAHAPSK